jgi:hypothetical protein
MNKFVGPAFGSAVGTLLYTRFLSDAHQFDWRRAIVVGLFVGLGSVILSMLRPRKNREQ